MEEKKIFGVYHGSIRDVEKVNNLCEQSLYFMIDSIGAFLWKMNHGMADGRIEEKIDLTEYQYAIQYCVYQTRRFGVEIPEPEENKNIERTPSYNAWFRWWDSYFKNELTREEFDEYNRLSSLGKDISKFRPKGDWKQKN